jgi:hypothetical protein
MELPQNRPPADPNRGALGRFGPGNRANPGGRTKRQREVEAEIQRLHCGQNVLDVLDRLRSVAMGEAVFDDESGPAAAPPKVQVAAAKVYLDRVLGAANQPHDAGEDDDLAEKTLEELLAEAQEQIKAKCPGGPQ